MKKTLFMLSAALVMCGFATPSFADTFLLTSCHITGSGCNGGSVSNADAFGSVTLTASGANVNVSVTLNNGNRFVETGSAGKDLFDFNDTVAGSTVINAVATLNGIPTALAVSGAANQAPFQADGFGNFTAFVHCTNTADCNGGSTPTINDLHFTVTGVTLAQLEVGNPDVMFIADILCGANQPGCSGGLTGPVDTSVAIPGPVVGAGIPGLVASLGGFWGCNWYRRKRRLA